MGLESNSGSVYYGKPIGVVSVSPNLSSNIGTSYYWISANDYILWGQPDFYPHSSSNSVASYHFLQCNVPSEIGLVLSVNNGTKYYYQSALNCIPFEGEIQGAQFWVDENSAIYMDQLSAYYIP